LSNTIRSLEPGSDAGIGRTCPPAPGNTPIDANVVISGIECVHGFPSATPWPGEQPVRHRKTELFNRN